MRFPSKDALAMLLSVVSLGVAALSLLISWRSDAEHRESSRATIAFSRRGDYFEQTPSGTELRIVARNVGSHEARHARFRIYTCDAEFTTCFAAAQSLANPIPPGGTLDIPVLLKRDPPMQLLISVDYFDKVLDREIKSWFCAQWVGEGKLIHVSPDEQDRFIVELDRVVSRAFETTVRRDDKGKDLACAGGRLDLCDPSIRFEVQ